MTIGEFMELMEGSLEHYAISDDFIHGYQQKDGGYIEKARDEKLLVDAQQAEPNQKWHFFKAYFESAFDEKILTRDGMARDVYNRHWHCPELLLWVAEAAGIDTSRVAQASQEAKEKIDAGKDDRIRASACGNIRRLILWDDIEKSLRENGIRKEY